MAKTETTEKVVDAPKRMIDRFSNRYIVFRSFLGLSLLVLAYFFFTPLLRVHSDWALLFLAVAGIFVLVMIGLLIFEYIVKVVRIQNSNARNYSALVSINTLLGLIIPLFYANLVLSTVIRSLGGMMNYQTFLCEIRYTIVNYYYWNNIYFQINQFIYWLFLLVILLFIVGGFIEHLWRRR